MLVLTVLSILAAIAAMAYVFGGLRRFDEAASRLEERAKARPTEPIPVPQPKHPLAKKPSNKEHA